MLVHVVITATITAKPTKIYKIYVTMAVLRNRCDLIGATHITVAPRVIYKDSPDPIIFRVGRRGTMPALNSSYIIYIFTYRHQRKYW